MKNLFGRWLAQHDPFQRAQQDGGVYLEGWNVGLAFSWIQQPMEPGFPNDEMEIEVEEPVVKRSTMQTVSESPSRREERAVEEAMGSFEEEMAVDEETTNENQSRKRKARELDEVSEDLCSARLGWTSTDFLSSPSRLWIDPLPFVGSRPNLLNSPLRSVNHRRNLLYPPLPPSSSQSLSSLRSSLLLFSTNPSCLR